MREVTAEKSRGSRLLKIALLCLVVYFAYILISQQMAIGEKRQQLSSLQQEIYVQELSNNELRHDIESNTGGDEHLESVARSELDYAKSGERVFVNIAGE